MKRLSPVYILALCAALAAFPAQAQKIFSCTYKSDADIIVYVSEYKSDADLVVYKTKYASDATGNDGIWFFTEYKSDAKKKIFFTEYKSDADLIIFFTEYKSDAGWQEKKRMHLLY